MREILMRMIITTTVILITRGMIMITKKATLMIMIMQLISYKLFYGWLANSSSQIPTSTYSNCQPLWCSILDFCISFLCITLFLSYNFIFLLFYYIFPFVFVFFFLVLTSNRHCFCYLTRATIYLSVCVEKSHTNLTSSFPNAFIHVAAKGPYLFSVLAKPTSCKRNPIDYCSNTILPALLVFSLDRLIANIQI